MFVCQILIFYAPGAPSIWHHLAIMQLNARSSGYIAQTLAQLYRGD